MDYAKLLQGSRFYGAKSEAIDDVEVVDSAPVGTNSLEILKVTHNGQSDLYQVLVSPDGRDVLGEPDVATEYGREVPNSLGTAFGDVSVPADATGKVIGGEQSNTSLIFGEVILKVYRHLEAGLNPDVELLSKITDCAHIAPVRGWVTHDIAGQSYTLAMVQDFVKGGQDGFKLALDYAGRGESFAEEARALGQATRAVHESLAEAFSTNEVPTSTLAHALTSHFEELAGKADVLGQYAVQVRAEYNALPDGNQAIQRIHGDLHLGQVLRTSERYVLIDFEGEPARPLPQRVLPDSPLRDVAGMVRSLDYAAHFHEFSGSGQGPTDPTAWAAESTEALLKGYGVERSALLDAYVLDKALYEVVYEANNRPDWLPIPLGAVKRILG